MIPSLGWLSPAFLASSALGGGRSPAGWQKLTAQAAGRVSDLQRLSSWVGFLENARPRLCSGPLLGDGLELAMTRSSGSPAKTELVRHSTGRKRPGQSEVRATPAEARAAEARTAPKRLAAAASIAAGLHGRTSAECLRLPSQADRAFLNALAKGRSRRRALRAQYAAEAASSTRDAFSVPELTAPVSPGLAALGDRLIRRVTQTIDRYAGFGARLRSDPGAVAGISISTPAALQLDPWSGLLEGPAADGELLHGLTAFPSGTGVSKPHHPAREGAPDGERRPSSPQHETLATTRSIKMPFDPPPGAAEKPVVSDAVGSGEAVPEEFRFQSPFQPAWMAGITRATPEAKAAGFPRRAADSAPPFDWNLESLSMAMKRILDEEARRHGIDV